MRPLPGAVDIELALISTEEPFQVRVDGLDEDHVEALVAACESGSDFLPPVLLARCQGGNGPVYHIIDGHHEVEAQQRAGRDRISAIVLDDLTDDQAIDLAWECNRKNAKDLTLEDRIAHASRLCQRGTSMRQSEIARICGISRTTLWRLENGVSRKQRGPVDPVLRYLRRVACDPVEWSSAKTVARAVRRAISEDDLNNFAQDLGDSALAALSVAEELGFSH